jgi:5-enolpyruvylshikimate-3-phosphate synthase
MIGPDATTDDAQLMVDMLQKLGYDVEYTSDCGLINRGMDDPIPEHVWESCLDKLPER